MLTALEMLITYVGLVVFCLIVGLIRHVSPAERAKVARHFETQGRLVRITRMRGHLQGLGRGGMREYRVLVERPDGGRERHAVKAGLYGEVQRLW